MWPGIRAYERRSLTVAGQRWNFTNFPQAENTSATTPSIRLLSFSDYRGQIMGCQGHHLLNKCRCYKHKRLHLGSSLYSTGLPGASNQITILRH